VALWGFLAVKSVAFVDSVEKPLATLSLMAVPGCAYRRQHEKNSNQKPQVSTKVHQRLSRTSSKESTKIAALKTRTLAGGRFWIKKKMLEFFLNGVPTPSPYRYR